MKLVALLLCFSLYVGCSEAHKVVSCYAGWTRYGDSCYHYFGQTLNQITAENVCRMFSGCGGGIGHLVSLNTKAENDFIFNHLKTISGTNIPPPVWLGGRRMPRTEQWGWSDGTIAGQGAFNAWPGNQAPHEQGRNCLTFGESPQPTWLHINCGAQNLPYVCEMKANDPVDPATCAANNPGAGSPNAPSPVVGQNIIVVPYRYNKVGNVEQRHSARP